MCNKRSNKPCNRWRISAVSGAISWAISSALSSAISDATSGAISGTTSPAISGAISRAMSGATSRAMSGGSDQEGLGHVGPAGEAGLHQGGVALAVGAALQVHQHAAPAIPLLLLLLLLLPHKTFIIYY